MSYQDIVAATANLVGYWKLDEASGTAAADAAGAATGTYTGGFTLAATSVPGMGTGVDLNGSNAYVDIPTISLAGPISVECWVKYSNAAQNGFLVAKEAVNTQWQLFLEGGSLRWRSSTGSDQISVTAPPAGSWHHLVATQSGTAAILYVDGVQVATGTIAAIGNGTGHLAIGRFNSGYYYSGTIDEVAVYGAALSAATVAAHFAAGTPRRSAVPPVRPLPFPPRPTWQSSLAPAGCRLYVPMTVGSGVSATAAAVVLDRSPYRRRGTAPSGALAWARGPYGWSLGPSTGSNYLEFAGIDPQILGTTFPCWIAVLASSPAAVAANVCSQGWSTLGATSCAYLQVTSATSALYGIAGATAVTVVGTGITPQDGRMHVLMGVSYSASDHRFYVDGREVGLSTTAIGSFSTSAGTPRVTVGALGTDSQYGAFGGQVAWFGLGNRAVPDPYALALDLLSGRFAAIRPRDRTVVGAVVAAAVPRGQKGRGGGKGAGHAVYRLGTRTPGTPSPGL